MGFAVVAAIVAVMPAVTDVAAATTFQARTRASLWYRGVPAGVPRHEDLHAIKAAGFTAVTWPMAHARSTRELAIMTENAGLEMVIRPDGPSLTAESALVGNTYADLLAPKTEPRLYPSIVWRAIAHGSRVISFDAGVKEGTGLTDPSGKPPAWLAAASTVARQVASHAVMVDTFTQGPPLKVDPQVAGLDVALIDAGRSWVLIATNTAAPGSRPADTFVYLPKGVPPAEWLNLFDGTTIAMLRQPAGPRWHILLGPGDLRIYAIGKVEG
jgi:hypothetical protein